MIGISRRENKFPVGKFKDQVNDSRFPAGKMNFIAGILRETNRK
jgi:hypothetical protein